MVKYALVFLGGGFTTFSSFSYETLALVRGGDFLYALAGAPLPKA